MLNACKTFYFMRVLMWLLELFIPPFELFLRLLEFAVEALER